MQTYNLKENEVLLFRNTASVTRDWNRLKKNTQKCTLLLTNLSFVFLVEEKKASNLPSEIIEHSTSEVKIYDSKIQIIRSKEAVDIYFTNEELYLNFENEKTASEFCNKALKLISGDSKFIRAVNQFKKGFKEVDDNLHIVEAAKKATLFAAEVTSEVAKMNVADTKTKIAGKVAEVFLRKNKKENVAIEAPTSNENNTQELPSPKEKEEITT